MNKNVLILAFYNFLEYEHEAEEIGLIFTICKTSIIEQDTHKIMDVYRTISEEW